MRSLKLLILLFLIIITSQAFAEDKYNKKRDNTITNIIDFKNEIFSQNIDLAAQYDKGKINLFCKGKTAGEVFKEMEKQAKIEIKVDEETSKRVLSILIKDKSLKEAIESIINLIGLRDLAISYKDVGASSKPAQNSGKIEQSPEYEISKVEIRKRTKEEMDKLSLGDKADSRGKPLFSKEIKLYNGNYLIKIDYEKVDGSGSAHYTIKNKNGEMISGFKADVAPGMITMTSDGERLISFGSGGGEEIFYNKLCFYNRNGELIKKYFSENNQNYSGKNKISKNDKYFVITYGSEIEPRMSFFDLNSCERLWDIKLGIKPSELELSKNGDWIIISGSETKSIMSEGKKHKLYKIYLFDKTGKIKWQNDEKVLMKPGGEHLLIEIGEDDNSFILKEREYKKDSSEKYINKKSVYKILEGTINLDSTIDNIYELEKP